MKLAVIGFDQDGRYQNKYYEAGMTDDWQHFWPYDNGESKVTHTEKNRVIAVTNRAGTMFHNPLGPAKIQVSMAINSRTLQTIIRVQELQYFIHHKRYDPAKWKFEFIPEEHRDLYESLGFNMFGAYRAIEIPNPLDTPPTYLTEAQQERWKIKI